MDAPHESEILQVIRSTFSSLSKNPSLLVGIGDDAAVIETQSLLPRLLFASDMAVESVHFRRDWSTFSEVGRKVSAANLADIVAMGGRPRFGTISVSIPESLTLDEIRQLAEGIRDEFAKAGAIPVGGDITRSPLITICMAIVGDTQSPILRSGAKVGDLIAISGSTGASTLGYELLKRGIVNETTLAHRAPDVDYSISTTATAMIDTSDGLVSDAGHIADSSHVKISLHRELLVQVPGASNILEEARMHGVDGWRAILHGGEDHRYLATFSDSIPSNFYEIGVVEEGSGVWLDGVKVIHEGFDQFR